MDAEFSNNENEPGSVISFLRKTVGSAVLLLAFALLPLMYCRLFQRQVPDFGLVKIPIAALTYLVMAFLLLTPEKLAAVWGAWSKSTRWVIVFMLGATLGQGFFHPGILGWGASLSLIILPLAAAVYAESLTKWVLPWGMTFIWVISVWRSLIDVVYGYPIAGVCGNWNWNWSVLIICLPFTMLLIWQYSTGIVDIWRKILLIFPIILTLLVAAVSNFSKGAVLGLAVALIFLAGARFKWFKNYFVLLKTISGGVLLILLLAALVQIFFPVKIEAYLNSDVRLSLWRGAVEYISGHPLGGGVGNYESFIVPYIPLEYYNSPFAAIRNPHPHNLLLFWAAEKGWLIAVAALIFGLVVISRQLLELTRRWDWYQAAVWFGLTVLFVHAQVDVVDLEYPTNLMLLTLFGVVGGDLLPQVELSVVGVKKMWRNLLLLAAMVLFIGGLVTAYCGGRASWLLRRGDLEFAEKDFEAAGESFEKSYNLRPGPEALYRMQNLLLMSNDYDAVLALNTEYEKLGVTYFMRHDLLSAIAAIKKGDYKQSLTLLEADLKRCPLSVAARIVKLNALLAGGDVESARKLEKELDELLRKRNLTAGDIPLMMNNYEFDLNNHQLQEYKKRHAAQSVADKKN